jgi:hypothetical protein
LAGPSDLATDARRTGRRDRLADEKTLKGLRQVTLGRLFPLITDAVLVVYRAGVSNRSRLIEDKYLRGSLGSEGVGNPIGGVLSKAGNCSTSR